VFAFLDPDMANSDFSAFADKSFVSNNGAALRFSSLIKFIRRNQDRVQLSYQFLCEQMQGRLGGSPTICDFKMGKMMLAYWAFLCDQRLTAADAYAPTGQTSRDVFDEE
jgi:hypothetical protein